MSTKIDQISYLKKYLGGSSGEKKKKKKKAVKGKGLKIIDDDLDLSKLRALDGDELDIFDEGEDAPQIAGIIDDRPEELKQLEQLKTSSKWKVINQDDGFNSKIQIEEIKKDIKEKEKENELIFGKMYSDSEDEKKNDSDVSPPRKGASYRQENSNKHRNSDSDVSLPRKQRRSSPSPIQKVRRNSQDSDQSPPRRGKSKRNSLSPIRKVRRTSSDSDQSPPRKEKNRHMFDRENRKRNNDSPPPSNKKMAKTLDGKLAGLQDARQLRQENSDFRKREEEIYNKMSDEVSGRNAKAVRRKDHRETAEKKQKQKEKTEKQKEIDEKYKKWSKGLKQLEDQEARVQEFMHEASKPLARHKGDRDLENNLKQIERDGDPMLQYIRTRKREAGELGPEKPSYKGQFPPNRFNIRPGYRWDGVDRSNGYEKKYFEQQSKKKAQEEEAYKWSTEDL